MAYDKHVWVSGETIDAAELNNIEDSIEAVDSAITAMSTATSSDVGKALKAKTVANGKVTAWEFGEAGGGGGGDTGNMQVAKDMTELLDTTADYVLVLKNDSPFGNGGPCIFFDQGSQKTRNGYLRTNGTRVYPLPSTAIPAANAPKQLLTNIIKTWIGRTDIVHAPSGRDNLLGLFATDCEADENDKYNMDCSDLACAILLGITYDNSRYVLGKSKDNVQNEMLSMGKMPASNSPGKTVGGLTARELAQWFAEQGRLFYTDTWGENMAKTLRFGDIIFGSNASSSSSNKNYFDIEHVMFVLGTMQSTERWHIIVAQCTSDASAGHEGTVCHIRHAMIYNSNTYYKVFARPNYRDFHETLNTLVPIGNGKYTYDCLWLPCTGNQLDVSTDGILLPGHKYVFGYMSSTDYCPVIPGSTIAYTGAVRSTATNVNYIVRCHEYDKNLNQVKRGQTLAYNGAAMSPIILDSETKYVQFTLGYSSNANTLIRYDDTDDFAVEVTPPSGAAS